MDYASKLKSNGKTMVTKNDLARLFNADSDESLYPIVRSLADEGILSPVKSAKMNGNRVYPLFMKYRVLLQKETFESEKAEISKLHPKLQRGGVLLGKPESYRKYREPLGRLNKWLFTSADLSVSISRKERSFEIFGEEKQLEDSAFCVLLGKMGLTAEELSYYDTPEYCFNDYIPVRKPHLVLLILENKDIWFNLRRMMFEYGVSSLFGTAIDGVVYGQGNRVSEAKALTEYTRFLGDSSVSYLYWGDVDRAGLRIFYSLRRANPTLDISLFLSAYEEMLRLSLSRPIPDSDDDRDMQDDHSEVLSALEPSLRPVMKACLADNKRLPQEIISFAYLKQNMR